MSWSLNEANRELADPNSPYYLGAPSVSMQIRNYLKGTPAMSSHKTNYFGKAGATFLARPEVDTVEIMGKIRERRDFNSFLGKILLASGAVVGLIFARKIPGLYPLVGKIFNGVFSSIGLMFSGIGKILR